MKPLTYSAPGRHCPTTALIAEMAEGYDELAEQMESCNNPEAAAMFHQLVRRQHYHLERLQEFRSLPPAPATSDTPVSLMTHLYSGTHYLMTPYHVVELALEMERQIPVPDQPTANGALCPFREERHRHVASLQQLLDTLASPDDHWDEDPDPPHLDQ